MNEAISQQPQTATCASSKATWADAEYPLLDVTILRLRQELLDMDATMLGACALLKTICSGGRMSLRAVGMDALAAACCWDAHWFVSGTHALETTRSPNGRARMRSNLVEMARGCKKTRRLVQLHGQIYSLNEASKRPIWHSVCVCELKPIPVAASKTKRNKASKSIQQDS